MKNLYKVVILLLIAILVSVVAIFWTPNVILCAPVLVYFSLVSFKGKKSNNKNTDLHLVALSTSVVIMILQIFILLDKNRFACNIAALLMSIINTLLLSVVWVREQSKNEKDK